MRHGSQIYRANVRSKFINLQEKSSISVWGFDFTVAPSIICSPTNVSPNHLIVQMEATGSRRGKEKVCRKEDRGIDQGSQRNFLKRNEGCDNASLSSQYTGEERTHSQRGRPCQSKQMEEQTNLQESDHSFTPLTLSAAAPRMKAGKL